MFDTNETEKFSSILTKISSSPILNIEKQNAVNNINLYSESGFYTSSKVFLADRTYPTFTLENIEKYMEKFNDFRIPRGYWRTKESFSGLRKSTYSDYLVGDIRDRYRKNNIKNSVLDILIQKSDEVFQLSILQFTIKEYSGVPPLSVIEKTIECRKIFNENELFVLDVQAKKLIVDDPILCAKLPDSNKYYFIFGWNCDLIEREK